MREGIAIMAFTERGGGARETAGRALGGSLELCAEEPGFSLAAWTGAGFHRRGGHRRAGHRAASAKQGGGSGGPLRGRAGRYVIPLLSGHLGGANALAQRLAALTGGEAVITTATDLNGLFAVDLWASARTWRFCSRSGSRPSPPKLLRGETVTDRLPLAHPGSAPELVELGSRGMCVVSRRNGGRRPAAGARGADPGDRLQAGDRGRTAGTSFARFCDGAGIVPRPSRRGQHRPQADEAGFWPSARPTAGRCTFTARRSCACRGASAPPPLWSATTGVDNVCERAAVCGRGGG